MGKARERHGRGAATWLGVVGALALGTAALAPRERESSFAPAFASITEPELETDLLQLASAPLEGRDSPSAGLERAAQYIEGRLKAAGFKPLEGDSYRRAFTRELPEPVPGECSLRLTLDSGETAFEYGRDFVPLATCSGSVQGELVFLGFGIESEKEHFDEVEGRDLLGKIALIVEGEPRHSKRFDGPELTPDATLWKKLSSLRDAKLAGVLVARRAPEAPAGKKKGAPLLAPAELGFRHTFATWNGEAMTAVPDAVPKDLPPTLEVSLACASALLGDDVEELARRIDRSAQPLARRPKGRTVALASKSRTGRVSIDNVVGRLDGSDPLLAAEFVVVGAHYDHIGVDDRGRIGFGADDNASGTAGMLEVAQALALAKPRRSVIACAFAAEEDGLLGSKAFCDSPGVPREKLVAMINLDMLGRGDTTEVAVLGLTQNPELEKLLERAKRLERTGVRSLVTGQGEELFARSDHYSFHQIGVPVLFFFEGLPIERNPDYHTWRDTVDRLDLEKIAHTARLALNTTWLLANDEERPPAPRESR